MSTPSLRDQVALITGGNSGIGLAVARALAEAGLRVAVVGRNRTRLRKAAAELGACADVGRTGKERASRVLAMAADVSKPAEVAQVVRRTLARFGRIDVLVNNAGIIGRGLVDCLSEREWDRVLSVNLRGAFLCARAVLPAMKQRRRGYVITISSLAGKVGMAGSGAYCASKFGLVGLSETIGEEGAPWNIRATAICPAYVNTPMVRGAPVPPARMIQPEDIAATVLYLLRLTDYAVIKEIVMERQGAE
ncbi:MAG: SDR family oxidoreductase [Nitrospirae bacterium]|nr:SDR family oxidoreductase [Nitrospirota bacterium]